MTTTTHSPPAARCDVYTYKEGLLSAVGHDVLLTVRTFTVEVGDGQVRATFDAQSVGVVDVVRDGVVRPGTLSDKDKRTIDGYVRDDVLHSRRYPKIEFRSTSIAADDDEDGALRVEGELTLHGRTRTVTAKVHHRSDRLETRIRLHQPDFGIPPFKAMLGALRIQADVDVVLTIPAGTGLSLGT